MGGAGGGGGGALYPPLPLNMTSRPQALLIWHLSFHKVLGVPKFPATVRKAPKFDDTGIVPGRNSPPLPPVSLCCGTTSTDRPPGPLSPRIRIPPFGPIGPISRHKCEAVQRPRVLRVSVAVFPPLPQCWYVCSVLTGPHAFVDDTAWHRSRGHAG